ncbi:hypothetical protein [Salinimicrobium xinjiangense]|uniref:hypothetical protein n=1 Tax=Salinimicrobium xinjiangense TaxID=438596 RepID=UPI0004917094|nr:hypothetical protein [Salinimicrobium xinjiangense]
MKKRLFTDWTWTRAFSLLMGILVIGQGIDAGQWPGIALGIYVAAMGLFGWGCASGSCGTSTCDTNYDTDLKK